MGSANLNLVRSIFAAWERGDYSSADWADPKIEYAFADGPAPGHWIGLSAMAEAMRDWLSAWEGYRSEAEEFRELDDEHVLVFLRARGGRGKTSGLELGQHGGPGGAASFRLRNGKVTRLVNYFDRDRALADLGISLDADSP